jgi:hypothetical protein
VAASEGQAAQQLWRYWHETFGRQQPPPLVSDGSGGHQDALLEVFGKRHGQRRVAGEGWHYLQVVKIHNNYRQVIGLRPRLIWGQAQQAQTPLAPHLAYVERTHLTSRTMNARLVRQTLRFSKRVEPLRAACDWGDALYNLVRPLVSLRVPSLHPGRRWIPRSPAMAAGLTDHLWTVAELLSAIPLFTNSP